MNKNALYLLETTLNPKKGTVLLILSPCEDDTCTSYETELPSDKHQVQTVLDALKIFNNDEPYLDTSKVASEIVNKNTNSGYVTSQGNVDRALDIMTATGQQGHDDTTYDDYMGLIVKEKVILKKPIMVNNSLFKQTSKNSYIEILHKGTLKSW